MSGFNENSVMTDQPQGGMEIPAAPVQPLATESVPEPSLPAGAVGLAWWDANKYFWKRSANGGCHLAPQDSYVADVLDRADHYMMVIAKGLGDADYAAFQEQADTMKTAIQLHDARDTAGVEGNALRRYHLGRLVIARKICGASAVSAEHRVTNELSRENGDVEKLKGDSEGFYASDVEKRESWGDKAIEYEFIVKALADGEVIPTDEAAFSELLAKRIGRSLYDDAVERGNRLKRPAQQQTATANKPSREELLALTA